ncbi:hypothetical protein [Microbacterium sp.]|uniref:hypothetical protein n=1 Tax=Microbacterium sp. TaxID=51671 RepID=UPI003F7083AE
MSLPDGEAGLDAAAFGSGLAGDRGHRQPGEFHLLPRFDAVAPAEDGDEDAVGADAVQESLVGGDLGADAGFDVERLRVEVFESSSGHFSSACVVCREGT